MFKPASKKSGKLRLGICGPAGSGKTMTALRIAMGLCPPGGKIAVIDTEEGSASLYQGEEVPEGVIEFHVLELSDYDPDNFTSGIKNAGDCGFDVIIIDSITHAWYGVLDVQNEATQRSKSKNSYMAWRTATPMHNKFVHSMLSSPSHVIATMRSKTEYVNVIKNGKSVPEKVGMAPIQRDGMDYEFTVVFDMDTEHNAVVTKSRCSEIADKVFSKPGGEVANILKNWLGTGATPQEQLESALKDVGISSESFTAFCESKGKKMETEAQIWSAARWVASGDGAGFVKGWEADTASAAKAQAEEAVKAEPEDAEEPEPTPSSGKTEEVKGEIEDSHLSEKLKPKPRPETEPPTKAETSGKVKKEIKGININPGEKFTVHESWNDDEKRRLYGKISQNLFHSKHRQDMPEWDAVMQYCKTHGSGRTPDTMTPAERDTWTEWYNRAGVKKVKDFVWSEDKRAERVAEGGA